MKRAAAQTIKRGIMDFRPDMDAHLAAKKRQYVKRKKRIRTVLVLLIILTILAVWAIIGVTLYRLLRDEETPDTTAQSLPQTSETLPMTEPTETQATITTRPPKDPEEKKVTVSNTQIGRGTLILVSPLLGREYDFDAPDDIKNLYGNKTSSYLISSTKLKLNGETITALNEMFNAGKAETGKGDYQITQGYRTYDEQKSIYDEYQEVYGPEKGAQLAATPGYSEHHSGYAFDMNVYVVTSGTSYSLGTAGDVDPAYNWIYENAAKYGFVLRYPDGKTAVTGITNEPWHFRYVGRGHASYMAENGLVLEEYIALLYGYPEKGPHLMFEADGVSYEVFYVAADTAAEVTAFTVPEDAAYTVSGNNWDGFIVTVTKDVSSAS